MTTNYVLIDFENLRPETLAALADGPYKVKVFVGAAQAKGRISFELSHSMQLLGASAEYVKIARSGRNALDMHIAYFIGRLTEKEREAAVYIISNDADYDPLLEYLRANGVTCKRCKTIAEVTKLAASRPRPAAQPAKPARGQITPHMPAPRKPHSEKLAPIIKQLHSLSGKPATRKKLGQTIGNYFKQHGGELPLKTIDHLIDELIRLKYVTQSGANVSYHLA